MKHQFNLEWNELPEDFRENKITEYIEAGEPTECNECDGAGTAGESSTDSIECKSCKGKGVVSADPEDLHQRDQAEKEIESRFPLYF